MSKIWIIVMLIYVAPQNAVDWPGPWKLGKTLAGEHYFTSEGVCRNEAVAWIGRVHAAGMLAPIRFQCVPFPGGLPVGATR